MSVNVIKLSSIIDELVEEKNINKELLIKTVLEGIIFAYEKRFPNIKIISLYNKKDDIVEIFSEHIVKEKIEDKEREILMKKALIINPNSQINDIINIPFEEKLGRIEISRLKQFIGEKIKNIESLAIYEEFKDKINTIINGVVSKVDSSGATISVYNIHAFLPRSLMIPEETLKIGNHIKALIKDVYQIPKNAENILLERNSVKFIQKLLELEIPEIFDGIIKIENIARVAGYKTKLLLSSRDSHINPAGTCIGMGGSRIKPILKELNNERLDLISININDKKETIVANSLKPAEVTSVEIKNNIAYVVVDKDQRAVAVGKYGQNISLASQLVGMTIEIVDMEKKLNAFNNNNLENNKLEK